MAKEKFFATEVDLCAAFIAALPNGWTSYAETEGWDILLVRGADGFQIGIQAKLKFNAAVVCQALEEWGGWNADRPGPDCRAVLVPRDQHTLKPITDYLGITVIRVWMSGVRHQDATIHPALPRLGKDNEDWPEWMPSRRHRLPDYIPDVPAGAPAPVQLTPWKIKALKLLAIDERRGSVSRADFKFLGLDHRRWVHPGGWLSPAETRGGYTANGARPKTLIEQHPTVYAEIVATIGEWGPPDVRNFAAAGDGAAL